METSNMTDSKGMRLLMESSRSLILGSLAVFLKRSAAHEAPIVLFATVYPSIFAKEDFPEPKKPDIQIPIPSLGAEGPSAISLKTSI